MIILIYFLMNVAIGSFAKGLFVIFFMFARSSYIII